MAEEAKKAPPKKDDKKPAEDGFYALMGEIVGIIVILYIISRLLRGFNPANIGMYAESVIANPAVNNTLIILLVISNVLSAVFLVGLIYSVIGYRRFADTLEATIKPRPPAPAGVSAEASKWQKVKDHVGSDNPSDWRLAILEADIMLDDLLDKLGVVGDTMADKLKKINPGDFKSLNNAWEAHKIRNAIAHEGSDFALTEREARRVIGLYETAFREFNFI